MSNTTNPITSNWESDFRAAKIAHAKKKLNECIETCEFRIEVYQIANDWQKQYSRNKKITKREIETLNNLLPDGYRAVKAEYSFEMSIRILGGVRNEVTWSIYNRRTESYKDLDEVFLQSNAAIPELTRSVSYYKKQLTLINQAIKDQDKFNLQKEAFEAKYSYILLEAIK